MTLTHENLLKSQKLKLLNYTWEGHDIITKNPELLLVALSPRLSGFEISNAKSTI